MKQLIQTAASLPLHVLRETLNTVAIISDTPHETTQGGTCLAGSESYWVLKMTDSSYAVGIATRGQYPWWTQHTTKADAIAFVEDNIRALGLQS